MILILPVARGFPKLPKPEPEISNSLNVSDIISIAKDFPSSHYQDFKLTNSPNDLYASCMSENKPEPSLGP